MCHPPSLLELPPINYKTPLSEVLQSTGGTSLQLIKYPIRVSAMNSSIVSIVDHLLSVYNIIDHHRDETDESWVIANRKMLRFGIPLWIDLSLRLARTWAT